HAVDVVGAKHANVVGIFVDQEIQILINGVRGTLEPALSQAHLRGHTHDVVVEQGRHAPCLGQMPIQAVTLVLGQYGDSAIATVHQVAQREVDQPIAASE